MRFFRNSFPSRAKQKGFTLVELMVVSFVLIGIIVAIWGILITSLNYITMAREEVIAVDDLKDVMETLGNVPFTELTDVFPNGGSVDPDLIGGFLLDNEVIVVRYPQGTGIDPLEVEVELTWTGNTGAVRSHIFKTVKTRYI
ncbi:MAG: prepilin-type N-terminal cleavage/methylation domain-containing protein [Candidatus Omnitrophota bacterium]